MAQTYRTCYGAAPTNPMKLVFPSSIAAGPENTVIGKMKDHVGMALRHIQLLSYTDLDVPSWQPLNSIRGMQNPGDYEQNQLLLFASSPATLDKMAPVVLVEYAAGRTSGRDMAVGFNPEHHKFIIAFADAKPSAINFLSEGDRIMDSTGISLVWSIESMPINEVEDYLPTPLDIPIVRAHLLSFRLDVPDDMASLVYRTVELRREHKVVSISAFSASPAAGGMQNNTRVAISMIYGSREDQFRAKEYLNHVLPGDPSGNHYFTEKRCSEIFDAISVIVHKTGDASDRKLTSRADLMIAKGASSRLVYDLLVAQHGCGYVGDPIDNPMRNDDDVATYDNGSYFFTNLEPFAHIIRRKYGASTIETPTAEDLAATIDAAEDSVYESSGAIPLRKRLAMSLALIADNSSYSPTSNDSLVSEGEPTWRQVLTAISSLFAEEIGDRPTRELIESVMAWIVLIRGGKTTKYVNLDIHPYVYAFFRPIIEQIASRQKLAVGRREYIGREAIERYTHIPDGLTRIYGDMDFVVSPNYLEYDMPKEEIWHPDAKSGHNILWFQDIPEDYIPHLATIKRELTNKIHKVCNSTVHFEAKERKIRGVSYPNPRVPGKAIQDLYLILAPFDPNTVLIHETLARAEIEIKDPPMKFNCFFDFATDPLYAHQLKVNKTNMHKYRNGKMYPAYEMPPITYEIMATTINGNPTFLPKLGIYEERDMISIMSARVIWTSQMGTFLYAIPDAEGKGYEEASWIDIVNLSTTYVVPVQRNIVVAFLDRFIRMDTINDIEFKEFHEKMRKLIDEGVAGNQIVNIPRDSNTRQPNENVSWISRNTIIDLVSRELQTKPLTIEIEDEGLEKIDSYAKYDTFVKTKWPRISVIATERHCAKYGVYQWMQLPDVERGIIYDTILKDASKQSMTAEEKMAFFNNQHTLYIKLQEIRDAYRVIERSKLAIKALGMNADNLESRARQILKLEKPTTIVATKRPKFQGAIRYEFQYRQPRLEEIKNVADNKILIDLFKRNVKAKGVIAFQTKGSDSPKSRTSSRDRKSSVSTTTQPEVNIHDQDFGF